MIGNEGIEGIENSKKNSLRIWEDGLDSCKISDQIFSFYCPFKRL
jgi:hypothetical protein